MTEWVDNELSCVMLHNIRKSNNRKKHGKMNVSQIMQTAH